MEEKNKKATQEGVNKAAKAYADNREISVQDGAGYPFKEEIMRAFIVGAAWQKQRLIDKACTNLRFFFKAIDEDYDCQKFIDWFKKEMEE